MHTLVFTHHIINMPKMTHWGLSINIGRASSSSSSGKTGASLSTVVKRLTVDTVTRSKNAVSTSEHFGTFWQCKMDVPKGTNMAALAQSTMAWWNRRPWLHLRWKCILLWLIMTIQCTVPSKISKKYKTIFFIVFSALCKCSISLIGRTFLQNRKQRVAKYRFFKLNKSPWHS